MYKVSGNCTPLKRHTTEGSPSRTWQAGGGSFLLLPRRCAFSSREFNELLPVFSSRHLSFKTRGRMYSACVRSAMLHASSTWPLTKPNLQTFAAEWQGNDQTDLQCQAARHCHHQIHWATCADWHWGSGPHSLKALLVWTCGTLQSRQPVTYRLMESVNLGGPRWHGNSWQRGIAEWKLSAIDPHDRHWSPVWDLPCVQQVSYLKGEPLMWMLPLFLRVNKKFDVDDDDDDDGFTLV